MGNPNNDYESGHVPSVFRLIFPKNGQKRGH